MRFNIYSGLSPKELLEALPIRYRERAVLPSVPDSFDLVLFSTTKNGIVLSGALQKALRDVPESGALAVAAAGFTHEALALLRARDAVALTLGDHPWTDADILRNRQATRLPREPS